MLQGSTEAEMSGVFRSRIKLADPAHVQLKGFGSFGPRGLSPAIATSPSLSTFDKNSLPLIGAVGNCGNNGSRGTQAPNQWIGPVNVVVREPWRQFSGRQLI